MDIAIKQFYERFIDSLIQLEKTSPEEYLLLKDKFFMQLEEHIDYNRNLNSVVADLKSVSQRLLFIDDRIKERANKTYKDIPVKYRIMGEMLKSAFEKMDLSIKNEDFRDACKFIVIQAEIISEYLFVEFDLIRSWIAPNHVLASKYKFKENTGYLTTWYKLEAAGDYSGYTWDEASLKIIKDIRDYGSHGYHESSLRKHESDISIVSRDYQKYFREWFRFINAVKLKLYSKLVQPISVSQSPVSTVPEPAAPPVPEPAAPPVPEPAAPPTQNNTQQSKKSRGLFNKPKSTGKRKK